MPVASHFKVIESAAEYEADLALLVECDTE